LGQGRRLVEVRGRHERFGVERRFIQFDDFRPGSVAAPRERRDCFEEGKSIFAVSGCVDIDAALRAVGALRTTSISYPWPCG
jgi:hypothetical protein